MTVTLDTQGVDLSTLKGSVGVTLGSQPFYLVDSERYEELMRAKRNIDYLNMLERSREQCRKGQVVVTSLEELEAMAAE